MEEISKNCTVNIKCKDGLEIDGIVFDYTSDRVLILVAFDSIEKAKKLEELDKLLICVKTKFGLKKMVSHLINKINSDNCIVVENAKTLPTVQKREFVRIASNLQFEIIKLDNANITCYTDNISAGGVAFKTIEPKLELDENVLVVFPASEFDREIRCSATIIKANDCSYVAQYKNLNSFDEDRIVKYVFKLISQK